MISQLDREIAEKIRSGEYFADARAWYSQIHHWPMVERTIFIVITVIAGITTTAAIFAWMAFLPVAPAVPFPVYAMNTEEILPEIAPIGEQGEDIDIALIRHLSQEYIHRREAYDVRTLQQNVRRVRYLSAPQVYAAYQQYMQPQNPRSPIARFERHTTRQIRLLSYRMVGDTLPEDEDKLIPERVIVKFEATIVNRNGRQKSYWEADMALQYKPMYIDQETYEVKPMDFKVSEYKVKEITVAQGS